MSEDGVRSVQTVVCARSATPRAFAEHSEDAWVSVRVPHAHVRGVVVADGLGSYSRAGEAARQVVQSAAAWLRDETEDFGRGTLPRLFGHVHAQLREHVRHATGGEPEPQAWGTTLLVGLEAGTELVAAYAGNGAVWHLRGNFDGFTDAGVPWNAVNLLNPHTVQRDGREVLYNLVDAAQACPPVPTVVSVLKDPVVGDILLLCTDGLYSADQVTHGTDAGGGIWVSAEATMVSCFRALRDLFAGWDGEAELPLGDALQACLDDLRTRGMLEDDATVGVIVTADALRYQRRTGGKASSRRAVEEETSAFSAAPSALVAEHAESAAVAETAALAVPRDLADHTSPADFASSTSPAVLTGSANAAEGVDSPGHAAAASRLHARDGDESEIREAGGSDETSRPHAEEEGCPASPASRA
jgi:serine/threonine protein phosphatase PrpC